MCAFSKWNLMCIQKFLETGELFLSFYSYVLCSFRTWPIIVFHNLLLSLQYLFSVILVPLFTDLPNRLLGAFLYLSCPCYALWVLTSSNLVLLSIPPKFTCLLIIKVLCSYYSLCLKLSCFSHALMMIFSFLYMVTS